ncbi:MAG: SRPBCC family protein [Acidimicrobiales bacterium]
MGQLTKKPPEWIHAAPFQASATREIDATPDEVFAALADHERWPEWFTSIIRVERFGDLHEGVGSNRRVFINARVAVDEEFNVWEPGERWGFVVLSATVPGLKSMTELVTIADLGDGRSSVTYKMGIEGKFPLSLLLKGATGQMNKNLGAALDNLGPHIAAGRAAD